MSDETRDDSEIERRNASFMKRLREMSNVELASYLEAGGKLAAPNPNYVLEAARRLRGLSTEE